MNYEHKGEEFHTKGIENILNQTTEEHFPNLEKEIDEELGRKRNGIKRSAGQILGYC